MIRKHVIALAWAGLICATFAWADLSAQPGRSVVVGDDTRAGDHFGSAVAVSGNTMVATSDDAVYVFVRDLSGWRQQSKLWLEDGDGIAQPGKVAISGDTIAVGAPLAGLDSCYASAQSDGRVYVFERTGDEWVEQAVLMPFSRCGRRPAQFGLSVSLSGDTIAAGALTEFFLSHGPTGDVGVFVREGTTWSLQQTLPCGLQVQVEHDRAAVSEPGLSDTVDNVWSGRFCIYDRAGTVWSEEAEILPPDYQEWVCCRGFGAEVFLSGDTVALRDFSIDGTRVYEREAGGWIEQAVLAGRPLALADDLLAVVEDSSVWLYMRGDGTWSSRLSLETTSSGSVTSGSLGAGNLAVGVPTNAALGAEAGVVIVLSPWGFRDVLPEHWAESFIRRLTFGAYTVGCGNGDYCPEAVTTRAQAAVFLERGMKGNDYVPPAATGNVFLDVGVSDFAASFVEQLYLDGITAGCGGGRYCPRDPVTRSQAAVMVLRAIHGAGYTPPPPSGVFADVDVAYWAASWIEQLAAEGITNGCGGGRYCPEALVTRAQMAVFLVRAFDL